MPIESPHDPPRPGRIILPGQESSEPDAEPSAPQASRIVLPPGARHEDAEELPEYPRLRPLEIVPIRDGERDMLLVTDPLGVMPSPVALRIETIELLRVLNGQLSLNDLATEVVRGSKDLRAAAYIRDFVGQLDRLLMLESPRFDAAYQALRDQYHRLEIRQAILGGISYPEERAAAETFVDAHFAQAEQMRVEAGEPGASTAWPRALAIPHLDPRRGGPTLARALIEPPVEPATPLRMIVYGVGHGLIGDLFALTRKHYETPFGRVECDTAFVDAVAARIGPDAYRGELAHRDEHSIEFAALYLQRRFGNRRLRMVPILCGSFHALLDEGREPHDVPALEQLVSAVRETERSQAGDTVHIAAVDLSHVGPRFGDPPLDDQVRAEVEAHDREALEAARRGDARGWHAAIAAHGDSTRICGWSATWVMLRCAEPGEGRLLRYEISEEADGSMVSIAALAWP